jgi:phosphate uptake regulator
VPVTAKLSRKFYEKFGDDIANELVEWFNAVDATYRSDLREVNELNFERFDAKLEQRVAQLNAKIDTRAAELNARIDHLAVEVKAGLDHLETRFDAKLTRAIADLEVRLTRRMFGFWVAQAATTVGLIFGVLKLLH